MDIGKIKASISDVEKELKAFGEVESPTDEQVTEVEAKVSELEKLQANLQSAEATAKAEQLNEKISALLAKQNTGGQLEASTPVDNSIKIPASAKPRRSLKAFGNDHESLEAAYVSGRSIAAGLFGHSKSKEWLKDHGIQNTTLYEGEDQKGGIFVPTEMELAIIRLVESFGVFRRFAKSVPMNSDRKVVPVRTGGLTAYAIGETAPSNEGSNSGTRTSPTYNPIELIARKWKAWLKMSDEVNEDSMIQLADEVSREMALAFSYAEDNAGFNGDGSSTYNGVTGALNVLAAGSKYTMTAAAGNLAFADLTLTDFESVIGKTPHYENFMPAWFISKAGYYASMDNLKNASGGNTSRELESGNGLQFLGYPVVWTQVLPTTIADTASTTLAYFGDLRMAALFGDRRGMTMSVTEQRYWDEDQIAVKGTERFDINIHSAGTATEAGALIAINTPAS